MELNKELIIEALNNDENLMKEVSTSFFTPQAVETYLNGEEGKKLIQPKLDSYFSKGLDTWKNNNLQRMIDEEVSRRNPAETPEQKAIRELEAKMAKAEADRVKAEQLAIGQRIANEKGLPASLVGYFLGDNESATRDKINFLEMEFKSMLEKQVEARLKATDITPKLTNPTGGSTNTGMTSDDFMKMSYAERVELYNKNPQLYMQLAGR